MEPATPPMDPVGPTTSLPSVAAAATSDSNDPDHTELLLDGSIPNARTATEFDLVTLRSDIIKSPYCTSTSALIASARGGPVRHYTADTGSKVSFVTIEPLGCIQFRFDGITVLSTLRNFGVSFTGLDEGMLALLSMIDDFVYQAALFRVGRTPAHKVWRSTTKDNYFKSTVEPKTRLLESSGEDVMITPASLSALRGRQCSASFVVKSFRWQHHPQLDKRGASAKIVLTEMHMH